MRFGALLSFCALLSCGARTPLREPDDCPEAFAEGVNDFDLADDEAIVARNDAIVALRKSDGAERVIVAERAERVVTNGCELAWMTGSNVDRARLDGTERRNLHKSIGWDETSLDAIAIDAIGNVALTRTFGSSASTEVFSVSGSRRSVAAYGPSLTFRDGIVYGSRGGVLHLARIGDETRPSFSPTPFPTANSMEVRSASRRTVRCGFAAAATTSHRSSRGCCRASIAWPRIARSRRRIARRSTQGSASTSTTAR